MTPTLHVVNGDSTAACFRWANPGLGDRVLVHRGLLSWGPLPPLDDVAGWFETRGRFFAAIAPEGHPCGEDGSDVATSLSRLAAGPATVWIGTGLPEQLLLIWLVALLRTVGGDPTRLAVVQFTGDLADREIVGTGVLHPDGFRDAPEPVSLTPAAEDEAVRAWNAVTAPTPDALQAFLDEPRPALPLLGRALRGLVHHYPDKETGLNAWDLALLQQVREVGPRAVRVIGHTMAEDRAFPEWASDAYLFWRLRRLGDPALPRPLLTLSGAMDDMRQTHVSLTADGEALLAGGGHFVEWNGIDEHVAGVHLRSATGDVWYRAGERLVPAGG